MPNVTACHYSSVALTVLLLGLLLLLLLLLRPALLSVASLAACSKHDSLDAFKKEVNLKFVCQDGSDQSYFTTYLVIQ